MFILKLKNGTEKVLQKILLPTPLLILYHEAVKTMLIHTVCILLPDMQLFI